MIEELTAWASPFRGVALEGVQAERAEVLNIVTRLLEQGRFSADPSGIKQAIHVAKLIREKVNSEFASAIDAAKKTDAETDAKMRYEMQRQMSGLAKTVEAADAAGLSKDELNDILGGDAP